MSRRKLTAKQHAFLEYIKSYVRENGIWPTYREIIEVFDYRSPNSVTQNLQALYKKNYLRRDQDGYHLIAQNDEMSRGIPIRPCPANCAGSRCWTARTARSRDRRPSPTRAKR